MDTPWHFISGAAAHERRIVLCVLASLALHALVLFLFPELRSGAPSQEGARMLIARFARRAPEPPPTLSEPKQRPSPAPQTPRPAAPAGRIGDAPPSRDGAQRQAGAGAGSEFDRGSVEQFRIALIGAARRYKRYPAQALERGWQGKVEIRLVIGPGGTVQSSVVKASSGHEILDNQALDMVRQAKPQTPVPPALRGREFSVDIPVIFDLQSG